MILIGLLGAAGSGKTTVAAHLEKRHGAVRYSFADPLKQLAMRTLDFTREQCYGTQEQKETVDPRYGFSPRWFLQRLGTDGCREVFGEDFWTGMLLDKILNQFPEIAVIEDVRFVNEAQAIQEAGGVIWRLECPDRQTTADATHASEAEWMDAPCDETFSAPRSPNGTALLRLIDARIAKVMK